MKPFSSISCLRKIPIFGLTIVALGGGVLQTAHAGTGSDTWLGNADGNWGNGANWTSTSANKPPIAGDSLIFGAAGTAGTALNNNLTANTSFAGMTFNTGADAFTFSGNAITLGGTVVDNAANTETINFPMALPSARTLTVTNGGNLVLGGIISGAFNLTVNLATVPAGVTIGSANTGTVTLNGSSANTYSGATIVGGGTLLLDFANMATPQNLISNASSLTLGGLASTLSIKGNSSGTTAQTFSSVTLNKNFGSSIILNPNGGAGTTLTLGNTWNRGGTSFDGNTLNIDLSAGGTLTTTPSIAVNNLLGFATVKDASGIGFAAASGGNIVRLTGQTALPTSGASATVNYMTSGSLTMGHASFSVNSLTLDASSGAGTLDLGGSADVMTLSALGLLMIGGNDFTVQNGQVGATAAEVIIHQVGTGTLTINGTVGSGSSTGITKNGAGTLVLGSANSGSTFTINQGTVKQGAVNALGNTNLSLVVNNGGILDLGGNNLTVGLMAGANVNQGTITNSGALASLLVGSGGQQMSLGGVLLSGPLNLIVNGGGQLGLSPFNLHTGGTTFQNNNGTVANYRLNTPSALGTGPLTFNGGGTLQQTTSLTVTNAVAVNGCGNTWWLDSGTYWTTGPWSGSGTINIVQDTTKSPTFTFSNDMSGFQGTLLLTANTNVSASGTVFTYSLGGNSAFDGSHAAWDLCSVVGTVSSLPVLQWAGIGSQVIRLGDLNSAGATGNQTPIVSNSVAGTTATFEVGNLNQNSVFAGALVGGAGTVALTKVGSGTWTLSAANTYTGATIVSNGTLLVNGSLAAGSAVTVAVGTLGGTGTIGGSVTFNSGTHVLLTNGASLTLSGALVVAAGGTVPDVHLSLSNNVPAGSYTLATYNTSGSSGVFNSTPVLDRGSFATGMTGTIITSGGTVVLQVAQGSIITTTTVASSGNPATYGQTVTFTATVAPASGTTVPTGTVQFKTNGVALGAPITVTAGVSPNGTAAISTANLPVGTCSVTAEYTATGGFTGSTNAPALIQTMNQATPSAVVSSSLNPSGYQDAVYFVTTLPADATGSVVFSSANGPFSTNVVSAGSATSASLNSLARGTDVIIAVYSGDANYLSVTNALNQTVTNHPPVAGLMTVTRTAGMSLHVAFSDLATNWSDADGDVVALADLNFVSTNGVNLATNSSWILYTNSPNVNDQISYSISDGYGGTNIGFINIVIVTSVTGTNSITGYSFGAMSNTVSAYGIPGYSYVLERATNLAPAVWIDVSTNMAATNGVINAADTFSDLGNTPSSAYYRFKWQP